MTVTDYWRKYYSKDGDCKLCGNSGIIRGMSCICPNGQHRRKALALGISQNRKTHHAGTDA